MPLSEMDDLSWGLDLTGVLVGEIKERADPGLVKLHIVRTSAVDPDPDSIVSIVRFRKAKMTTKKDKI
jgi:hypothetical protein